MKNLKMSKGISLGEVKQQLPDARKHQIISFVKSAIRIVGYIILPFNIWAAALLLVMSEVMGIYEELV